MTYSTLIFDLDGTISDPKDGIVRSLNYALEQHGFAQRNETGLLWCIGPPLDQSFSILINDSDQEMITSLVASYRERYAQTGYSENVLYPGIREFLESTRKNPDVKLGLCTSKRVDFAEQILKMFDLYDLFDFISGGNTGIEKAEQLAGLIREEKIDQNAVMIGDRSFDMIAAQKNNLHAAGVLWGYGSKKELEEFKPAYLFETPQELNRLCLTA